MDENVKKNVMIGAVVLCIVAAVVIFFINRPTGTSIPKGKMTWAKCTDPDCGHTFEVPLNDYVDYLAKNYTVTNPQLYPCEKCGKNTCTEASKCEKCGHVFLPGAAGEDFPKDKCPECGFSEIEESVK